MSDYLSARCEMPEEQAATEIPILVDFALVWRNLDHLTTWPSSMNTAMKLNQHGMAFLQDKGFDFEFSDPSLYLGY